MSADFSTFIRLNGTNDEILAMLNVLKKYENEKYEEYCKKHNTEYIESVQINNHQEFFLVNCDSKYLADLSDAELKEFLNVCEDGVYVFASGPWGAFGWMNEITFPYEMAEASPNAAFEGNISGWNTCGDQEAEFELIDGLLYLKYAFHGDDFFEDEVDYDEDYDDNDEICKWDVEEVYNPIVKQIIESHDD